VSGKNGRLHPRVVHPGNGQSHDDGGNELLRKISGAECQPESDRRRADRYDHRERNEQRIVTNLDVALHRRHAGVMHGDDAKSHEDTAEDEVQRRTVRVTDHVKAAAR